VRPVAATTTHGNSGTWEGPWCRWRRLGADKQGENSHEDCRAIPALARRTKAAEACGILDGVAAIGSSPRVATHRARTPTLDNGASHAPIAATRIGGRSRPSCAVDHRGARGEKPWSKACAQPSRLDAPCALADVPRAIWRVPCRGRHCPVPCCAQARGCVRLSFECR
jgi:hypothetical protein